jgi:hypothetical protein
MQTGREGPRMATNAVANLEAADEPSDNETVVLANISERGARIIAGRPWDAGKKVIVSDSLINFRTEAEVVYCLPHTSRQFAIGLRFSMPCALAAHIGDLRAI